MEWKSRVKSRDAEWSLEWIQCKCLVWSQRVESKCRVFSGTEQDLVSRLVSDNRSAL